MASTSCGFGQTGADQVVGNEDTAHGPATCLRAALTCHPDADLPRASGAVSGACQPGIASTGEYPCSGTGSVSVLSACPTVLLVRGRVYQGCAAVYWPSDIVPYTDTPAPPSPSLRPPFLSPFAP